MLLTLEKLDPNFHLPEYAGIHENVGRRPNLAVFLDRDGVVNKEVDFVTEPSQLVVLPGAPEAIKLLSTQYYVIIVTNQSAIGRGLMNEDQLFEIHAELLSRLGQDGAAVDGVYYCPHHPKLAFGAYMIDCKCRKPNPGMLLQAAERWHLDLAGSFLIGDRQSDMDAAVAAGVRPILVGDGTLRLRTPVTSVSSLLEAAMMILNETSDSSPATADGLRPDQISVLDGLIREES